MKPPEQSKCLYSISPTNKACHGIKVFLAVKERPHSVFDIKEYGQTVAACVQGAIGQEFEVVLYDGREKKGKKDGFEVSVLFGEDWVGGHWRKPGCVKEICGEKDDCNHRFNRYATYRVDDNHVRPFRFAKVATTEDEQKACDDVNYLSNLSVIKIEYRRIKQAPREKKAEGQEKEKKKKVAKGKQKATERYDPMEEKDDRLLSEKTDKASFALNASFGDLVEDKREKGSGGGSSWKWVYVDKDKVDLTFILRIRSQAWVESFLANDDLGRTPSPPPKTVEIGRTLYLDFDEDEAKVDASAAGNTAPVVTAHDDADSAADNADGEEDDDDEEEEEEDDNFSDPSSMQAPPAKKPRVSFAPTPVGSAPGTSGFYDGGDGQGGAYGSGSASGSNSNVGGGGFWSRSATFSSMLGSFNGPTSSSRPAAPAQPLPTATNGACEDSSPEVSANEYEDLYGPAPGPDGRRAA